MTSPSIKRFQTIVQRAQQEGRPLGENEVAEGLKAFDRRGHSKAEVNQVRRALNSGVPMDPGAKDAMENFAERRVLPGRQDVALARANSAISEAGPGGATVLPAEMERTLEKLDPTRQNRQMAYGWLKTMDLTPESRELLKAFIYQPPAPLPPLDETRLREELIQTLNGFHHGETLPSNDRPWGNRWMSRPDLDLSNRQSARMELGENVSEKGWSYAVVVTNRDRQPEIPSTDRSDSVWFERRNKATGEVQYLANAPYSWSVAAPSRFHEETGRKPLDLNRASFETGKAFWDGIFREAFPFHGDLDKLKILDKKQLKSGNWMVELERTPFKKPPERVSMSISPFGIPIDLERH